MVLFATVLVVDAQHYILSNIPQLSQKKSLFHRPIGKNDNGTYFLNYAQENLSDGFSIEQFDEELGYVRGRFFEVGKKIYVLKVFSTDSGIYWISIYRKRYEKTKVYLNRINLNLEGNVETRFVGEFELDNIRIDQLYVDCSTSKKNWSLVYIKETNHETSEIGFSLYNLNGTELLKQKSYLNSRNELLQFEETALTDSGQFLGTMVCNIPKDFSNRGLKLVDLYLVKFSDKISEAKKMALRKNYSNSEILVDPITQNIIVSGLYGDSKGVEIEGCFLIQVNCKNFSQETLFESDFSETLVKQILGIKNNKKNKELPRNFFMRRVINTTTGKFICIIEQYSESKQLETYYINGIPQTSTRILYHCGDIGVLFIDSQGVVDSCVMVRKDQTGTIYNLYLMGIATFVCQDGLHILYNSDIARNNEVVDVVIQANYASKQKVLLNSDNFYNMIVPIDGKEMEYCTFTVPLYRDKQWFWMQINGHD